MPYPECSTTCEECDSSCHNYKHCKEKCYMRFHPPRKSAGDNPESLFPLSKADVWCAIAIFVATVLASAAGIGGGAVLVPLYTMLGEVCIGQETRTSKSEGTLQQPHPFHTPSHLSHPVGPA
jgi:hypothetical protein